MSDVNIGRLITGPDDLGYDLRRCQKSDAEMWLEQLNDDAAHNDGQPGDAARTVLKSSRSIVRRSA